MYRGRYSGSSQSNHPKANNTDDNQNLALTWHENHRKGLAPTTNSPKTNMKIERGIFPCSEWLQPPIDGIKFNEREYPQDLVKVTPSEEVGKSSKSNTKSGKHHQKPTSINLGEREYPQDPTKVALSQEIEKISKSNT